MTNWIDFFTLVFVGVVAIYGLCLSLVFFLMVLGIDVLGEDE